MSSQFKNECNWVILVNMTERGPLKIHPTIKFIKKMEWTKSIRIKMFRSLEINQRCSATKVHLVRKSG